MSDRAKEILTQLTLEEKAALTSGVSFWETTPVKRLGLDSVKMTDGPHGLRVEIAKANFGNIMQKSAPSTCFPSAVGVASTWDRRLAYEMGHALADEAKELGVSTVLGPGINMKRNPLCGRNFEYFSEDPYLAGEMGAAYVDGCQSNGVGTSLKHFAVNSQEWRRMVVSSEVDERALREIYLSAFEKIVKKSNPWTVMCSYNPVNGVHLADNRRFLTEILRDEWGYDGMVVSDWGAVNDRIQGVRAGMDLQMPGCDGITDRMIVEAVNNGTLAESELDIIVERIVDYVLKCMDEKKSAVDHHADFDKNHAIAREISAGGSVLLKNDDNVLPLHSGVEFLVVGKFAKKPRYQGTGSSQINSKRLVSFIDELDSRKIPYDYAQGFSDSPLNFRDLKNAALKKAEDKDIVVVFAGLTENDEVEAGDRETMKLAAEQNELISALADIGKKVVVVLSGGSSCEMPWIDRVKAVLQTNLSGEAGGEATADILFGRVNPSGKLTETYPYKYEDLMAGKYFKYGPKAVEYKESIYIGYRYYDKAKKPVMFPFGYGLSYTSFEYKDLVLSSSDTDLSQPLEVKVTVKNIGDRPGKEVVQLYVRDVESIVFMPEKELKGFEKVSLDPGEEKIVTFSLDKRAFSFYNTAVSDWSIEAGDFEILIGASSRDIRLVGKVRIDADKVELPDYSACGVYYDLENVSDIPDDQWEALKGSPIADNSPTKNGCYTMNSTVGECDLNWFARLFKRIFLFFAKRAIPKDSPQAMYRMTIEGALSMPIRNFYGMSGGIVPYETAEGILIALNGHVFKGLFKALTAFLFKDRRHTKEKTYVK